LGKTCNFDNGILRIRRIQRRNCSPLADIALEFTGDGTSMYTQGLRYLALIITIAQHRFNPKRALGCVAKLILAK
jgi:hypothetical protein